MLFTFRYLGSFLIAALLLPIFQTPAKPALSAEGITLSSQALSHLLDKQSRFFELSGKPGKTNDAELTRKAQEIVAEYESHLSLYPKDTNALILFGKFLRRVGQEEHAVDYFLEADAINPKLAVVKQQLANYLIEEGKPVDAFPYLIMTIELDPMQADYHFQLANFLFLFGDELTRAGIMARDSVVSFMHKSFKQSSELAPSNFNYHLRFAQSFFDFPGAGKQNALQSWNELIRKFPERSKAEKDYFNLCKARILLDLNQQSAALSLLDSVSSKALLSAKKSLIQKVQKKPQETEKKTDANRKQSRLEVDHRFFLPDDPHLQRLRALTDRIKEKRMLSELKTDILKARFDEDGQIKIDFSRNSASQEKPIEEKGSLR